MSKINFYQTSSEQIIKTFCLLSEKCYYAGTNTTVIIKPQDIIEEYDKILWTYSRKKYIPHATYLDANCALQPIYITHQFEILNKAKSIILVNISTNELVDLFDDINKSGNIFDRINILVSDLSSDSEKEYWEIIKKCPLINYSIQHFKQNIKGLWGNVMKHES